MPDALANRVDCEDSEASVAVLMEPFGPFRVFPLARVAFGRGRRAGRSVDAPLGMFDTEPRSDGLPPPLRRSGCRVDGGLMVTGGLVPPPPAVEREVCDPGAVDRSWGSEMGFFFFSSRA